jgi:hypothetical protein
MDLGNKTIKDFKSQTKIEMTTPQEDTTLQAMEATHKGLQNGKDKSQHPTITPTNILPKQKNHKTTNQTSLEQLVTQETNKDTW